MYRPEGFPKFTDDYVPPMPESFNAIFNWGADAMLEALMKDPNVLLHFNKGIDLATLIPEEE